ncbi:MAG: hypothetical protein CL663_00095 [Bacteroidetes bacterium]|nr:hypothetical protein [Bacteroidota bacterium]|tara:strand:- start:646 stop:1098 length:453 start_codon:yes stop_codon:yes gene_type:complete
MKTLLLLVITVLTSVMQTQDEMKSDKAEIKEVIQIAYVDGIQNLGDIAEIEKGFHPRFSLPILRNNEIRELPIKTWIESVKRRKAENPNGLAKDQITTVEFLNIDITGVAAVAKIKLIKGGKATYIDYLSLYKFEEGWRIVGKIYHTLPR